MTPGIKDVTVVRVLLESTEQTTQQEQRIAISDITPVAEEYRFP